MKKVILTLVVCTVLQAAGCGVYKFAKYCETNEKQEQAQIDNLPPKWRDAIFVMEKAPDMFQDTAFQKWLESTGGLVPKITRDQAKFIASYGENEADVYTKMTPYLKDED